MKKLYFLLILAMSVTFAMAQNGRTLYDFEDGTTQGWTAIDADGDGFSWGLHAPDAQYTSDVGHNESSYYFNSASYDNDSGTALSPNNFLVSPQVTLGGTISFWAQAQDPSYAAEHFGVAVSTTSATNASAFTTIQEWTMTAKSIPGIIGNHKTRSGNRTTNTWYEYTVDLSAYSGQGYVAIRHFNCTDQFILNVDDITIEAGSGGDPTPEGTITFEDQQIPSSWNNDATYPWTVANANTHAGCGGFNGSYYLTCGNSGVSSSTSSISATVTYVRDGSVSFLAGLWGEGTSTFWDHCDFYIDGTNMLSAGATDDWVAQNFPVTAGQHTFTWSYTKDSSVNPTGDFFGIDDVTFDGAGSGGGGGESIIYDFEDSTTQGWTTIDADGDGYTWVLGSAIGGIYLINGASLAGSGHNASNDLMCSGSYRNLDEGGGEVLTPDNYLVSPQVALGGSIDFWACGQDASYAAEHFGVAVSTTNNTNPSAFTVLQQWTLTAKGTRYEGPRGNRDQGTWYHFTVDLSAYAGQTGYIAIRHFNISDQFILDIDDITIVEGGGSSTQTYTITATPNPLEGGYITIAYRGDRDRQSYDFEDGAQGWTSIDADGDGYGWENHINTGTGNYTAHAGDGLMTSASYINDIGALTPDNYLVSPQVQLGGSITFYACAQDASYAAEHFGVAVSTTSNTNASAFTTLQEWTMTAKDGGVPTNYTRSGNGMSRAYYEYTVDLSAYAGQTGYVAIRHFDCTDQFYLNVDDITINEGGSGGQTGETVTGEFNEGQTCILTAIPFTGYHFVNWTENGTVVSTNAVYSFTVDSNRNLVANFSDQSTITYTITATPNPLEGGYITIDYRGNRDVVFSDDFETGISNWTLIDADGDGQNWYDLIDDNPNNIPGHNGSAGFATSASYSGSALTPDNYLVSPQVALNGTFSFWACAQDNSWAAEHFGVAVSTTNNTNAAAFTTIQEWTLTAKSGSGVFTNDTRDGMTRDQGSWYQYTVDLSAYAGQTGYIAIRHFNCTDMFRIVVDDVELTTSSGGQTGETVTGEFLEGQTCILTAIPFTGYHFVNWTENGTVVSTNAVYSFTVTGNRTLVANFSDQSTNTYTITATPNPLEGGFVTIAYRGNRDELTYDFEDGAQGWTIIDADGDGYCWESHINTGSGNHNTHSGDGVMTSASYDNDSGVALTPDNYLVSPQVQLGGSITFYACAQDASWPSEHFGVAVSTTSNTNAAAFTTIQEWTMTAKSVGAPTDFNRQGGNRDSGAYYEYTVDLSAYAGQTGYVAIRHFNCTDWFYLNIDDITIVEGGGGGQTGETVSAVLEEGQTCILTATPFDGYYFVNWTENGTEVSTSNVYTFEVTSDRTLFANFSNQPSTTYNVTVLASPAAGGEVTGGGSYAEGASCTVTATPAEGYTFVNWAENGTVLSTDPSYTFTVNENHTLVANFTVQSYTITLTANPTEGGTLTGGGTYNHGQYCTAVATEAPGYTFVNWTEDGTEVSTDASYYFMVEGNRNLVANFTINSYTVTVAANPTEGGTVTGGGTFTYGDDCTVSATEADGYTFINWTENGSFVSSELTFTFAVEANRNLVANFTTAPQPMHTITLIANPTEGGTLVGGGTYQEGQTCTVAATPAAGYTFINWTENDEEVSTDASYSFTITGDRTLVANFSIESYVIAATADPVEGGTITGTGTYEYGTEITLGIILSPEYSFVYWLEDGQIVSYDQDYTFTVTGNRTLVANLKNTDGVEELAITFGIYPNPVSDVLNIEASENIEQVEVFTITGAKVFSQKSFTEKVEINTTDLSAGTYIIRMTTKNASEVRRFVKF